MAKLYFRYGAMNSGKSTALLQAAYNYEERGQRVLLAKPAIDTKDADRVSSRLGVTRPVDFLIRPDEDLRALFAEHRARVQAEARESLLPDEDPPRRADVACLLLDEALTLLLRINRKPKHAFNLVAVKDVRGVPARHNKEAQP